MFRKIFTTTIYLATLVTFIPHSITAQSNDVYVDQEGVMRWEQTKQEVLGFGINYTIPFAHSYRMANRLGINPEAAIDQDVYHFARLGFDAFRIHVWDTEISDTVGTLLNNDHLRLLDYTIFKMQGRGMRMLITPIAFWGNGYPEHDEQTPGFSHKYGKDACLTNEKAIMAQERYLANFLNHINPYTGKTYKSDSAIIAFEISNEPHHKGTPQEVTAYMRRMINAMRGTGCKKPILYNVSHSVHLGETYFNSGINGGTFQWYPTGLGAGHELRGNQLPNVDRYTTPYDSLQSYRRMAKVVYEFDAADVGRSYIYPAMARSFREAGMQWATHFAYDPTIIADVNTDYNTHYMNLLYAPQKALSLMIAGEVFHRVPRFKHFGLYPTNTSFDGFHVSYERDLAEYSDDKKFYYTNSTSTSPKKATTLEHISGFGNSVIAKYDGAGAYFIDKLSNGVWRLEVYPDAIWVDNVFGRNSSDKKVAVLHWENHLFNIGLPDLGKDFSITCLTRNEDVAVANGNAFNVRPGIYVLSRRGVKPKLSPAIRIGHIELAEFGVTETENNNTYLVHSPYREVLSKHPMTVQATLVSQTNPRQVTIHFDTPRGMKDVEMTYTGRNHYSATLPADQINEGYLRYYISVTKADGSSMTFPSGTTKNPDDWDFVSPAAYTVAVIDDGSSLHVFNAKDDADQVSREWRLGSNLIPDGSGSAALRVIAPKLFVRDSENPNAAPIYDYSLRYNFIPDIAARRQELGGFRKLVLRAWTMGPEFPIQVSMIDSTGLAFGAIIKLNSKEKEHTVNLDQLVRTQLVTLPRPYPTFLPYFFADLRELPFNLAKTETIQISIGPGIDPKGLQQSYEFMLESIRLIK